MGSWWAPCVFQVKWWAPGRFLVFFQVKWWAPGGFLVFFQVKASCTFPSKMGSSEERALMKFKWVFCRDILGATLLFRKFRRKPGPQRYLLLRIARGNTGWALENNHLEKSHRTAGSVASESSPLSEASIVLEHVTWWVTRWEPFHHSFGLASEMAWLVALKMDP